MIIIFCLCIIFLSIYIFYINNNTSEIDLICEYSLSKDKLKNNIEVNDIKFKKKLNIDKFNIKEFSSINDNIIIHNKYKSELIEYQTQKHLLESQIEEIKKKKEKELSEQFEKNILIESKSYLNKEIKKLENDIKSLQILFKEDINNIINDVKLKKISHIDKQNIKQNVIFEINKIKKQLSIPNTQQFDFPEYNKKNKLLQEKLNILEKKLKIYSKII